MNLADLHIHTNASDGTDSPEVLLQKIRQLNIKHFAVTDHDTIAGALKLRGEEGFIIGVEFSCHYVHNKIHILGLNYDPENDSFKEVLRAGDEMRHEKFFKRVKFLRENCGIIFSDSEIEELLKIPGVGKPHLANKLVAKGFAKDKTDAIKNIIDKCRTRDEKLESEFVIKAILKSGGIPVWAHPLGGEGESELPDEIFRTELKKLISYGLRGLECYYSKYDMKTCEKLAGVARENNLYISGGSDYHGTNKKIPLGRLNSESKEIPENYLTIIKNF